MAFGDLVLVDNTANNKTFTKQGTNNGKSTWIYSPTGSQADAWNVSLSYSNEGPSQVSKLSRQVVTAVLTRTELDALTGVPLNYGFTIKFYKPDNVGVTTTEVNDLASFLRSFVTTTNMAKFLIGEL
jgi:hypothetical protein